MPRNNSKSRKAVRREEAQERQAEWDALTDDEKLAKVAARLEIRHPGKTDDVSLCFTREAHKIRRTNPDVAAAHHALLESTTV